MQRLTATGIEAEVSTDQHRAAAGGTLETPPGLQVFMCGAPTDGLSHAVRLVMRRRSCLGGPLQAIK